jgi:hypothetical protein
MRQLLGTSGQTGLILACSGFLGLALTLAPFLWVVPFMGAGVVMRARGFGVGIAVFVVLAAAYGGILWKAAGCNDLPAPNCGTNQYQPCPGR